MIDESFPVEFVGGSRDGLAGESKAAPDYIEVTVNEHVKEIYKRENDQPPFVYVQVGYANNETWT